MLIYVLLYVNITPSYMYITTRSCVRTTAEAEQRFRGLFGRADAAFGIPGHGSAPGRLPEGVGMQCAGQALGGQDSAWAWDDELVAHEEIHAPSLHGRHSRECVPGAQI